MKQSSLSKWLKFILIGVGICGLVVYLLVMPTYGNALVSQYPEFKQCYYPWIIMLWITAIPCYGVLILGWMIAGNIGKDKSFSMENAGLLKWVSVLAAFDSAFFFTMNVIYLFMNMNHPAILLLSLIVVFFGVAVTIASAVLSHLVAKAAGLQEESELTI